MEGQQAFELQEISRITDNTWSAVACCRLDRRDRMTEARAYTVSFSQSIGATAFARTGTIEPYDNVPIGSVGRTESGQGVVIGISRSITLGDTGSRVRSPHLGCFSSPG